MRCQPGFKAIGEVCHAGMISSPRLETGRPSLSCGYKVLDDGACYDRCRAGYYGSGEICHGREHPGYVKCGAGEAASYSMCSYVRRQQMLATINVNHGISGIWHIKLPPVYGQHVRQARGLIQELSNEVAPLKAELLPLFDEIAHGQHYDRAIQEASVDVNHYLTGARGRNIGKKLHQLAPGIVGASYKWDSTGDKSPMLEARLIFSITSKIDPKARIIAAYAYPISAPAVPRNESQVVNPSVRIHSKDLQQNTSAAPPMPANDVPGF